jgi:hypothetical protein
MRSTQMTQPGTTQPGDTKARFKVAAIRYDYPSTACERRVVAAAGGEFVDTDGLPLEEALRQCEDADPRQWQPFRPDDSEYKPISIKSPGRAIKRYETNQSRKINRLKHLPKKPP